MGTGCSLIIVEHFNQRIRKFITDTKILYSGILRLSLPVIKRYLVNTDIVFRIITGMIQGNFRRIPLVIGAVIKRLYHSQRILLKF